MRYLAIDLGDRRSGLATGDAETSFVAPLEVLEIPRGERLVEALLEVIERERPDAVVIGLPLRLDGGEGDRAALSRDFGRVLESRSGLPVHYQDERLSSWAADGAMARSGRTHRQKKRLRDALAAAEILREYLSQS